MENPIEKVIMEGLGDLKIRDKLPMAMLLANSVLTIQKCIQVAQNDEVSQREIQESIRGMLNLIPTAWRDDRFNEDLEKANTKKKVDLRPEFCGLRCSEEFCKKHGITAYVEEDALDYFKVLNAIMDLLNRRGLLGEVNRTEKMKGRKFNGNDGKNGHQ